MPFHLRLTLIFIALLFLSCSSPSTDETGPLGETTKEYDCPFPVRNKKGAVDCFNIYFEGKRSLLEEQRGTMPPMVSELLADISEGDIVVRDGYYHINRHGSGSPHYMKNGVIYLRLE